ncbi:MAG: hypothetical protein U0522_00800 [Candidatus Paceibacterota bacterium]
MYNLNDMDNNLNNINQVADSQHNKTRWVVIFIACLIVFVAIIFMFKEKTGTSPDSQMTPEQKLINSMTAKGPSNLTEKERQALIKSSTAKSSQAGLSVEKKNKLINSMTAK